MLLPTKKTTITTGPGKFGPSCLGSRRPFLIVPPPTLRSGNSWIALNGKWWVWVLFYLPEQLLSNVIFQNEAYYVIGTAEHCNQRALGELPIEGVRMCSEYISSPDFRSRNTDGLVAFAESFLLRFPLTLEDAQEQFEYMWWISLMRHGRHGCPAPNVITYFSGGCEDIHLYRNLRRFKPTPKSARS